MRRFVLGAVIACLFAAPTMVLAGDNEIAAHIEKKLREANEAGQLKNFGLDMHVTDGVVWFKGYVASAEQEKLVLTTAQRAGKLGVKKIVDEIEIKEVAQPAPVAPEAVETAAPAAVQPATTTAANAKAEVKQVATQQEELMIPVPPVPADSFVPPAVSQTNAVQAQRATVAQVPQTVRPMTTQTLPTQQVSRPVYVPQPQNRGGAYQRPMAAAPTMTPVSNRRSNLPQGGMSAPSYTPVSARSSNAQYDQPTMPNYAWPSYAPAPNYGALTYPKQYSPSAWPYIGPFYPYPQVPLGWRKVTMEWDDGWWYLDFQDR